MNGSYTLLQIDHIRIAEEAGCFVAAELIDGKWQTREFAYLEEALATIPGEQVYKAVVFLLSPALLRDIFKREDGTIKDWGELPQELRDTLPEHGRGLICPSLKTGTKLLLGELFK